MKKIFVLTLSIFAFATTSCLKQYNCTCTLESAPDSTYIKEEVKAVSVHRAHEKCYRIEELEGEGCMAKY